VVSQQTKIGFLEKSTFLVHGGCISGVSFDSQRTYAPSVKVHDIIRKLSAARKNKQSEDEREV
jgi:hypothetical protein